MKKGIKILTTLLLLLLVLVPSVIFLLYPIYNNLALEIKRIDLYNLTKDSTISFLTTISPTTDKFRKEEFTKDSIEKSIKTEELVLDRKILEELNSTLHIPSIRIEGEIFQGVNSQTMDKGFWHFPHSKYPGQKGNSVIIGHRFLHLPPAKDTFFNLDRIKIGDSIIIKHTEGDWTYIVTEIKEVQPNDISVIKESDDYRITVITCTPLWTSEKRLVVIGKLDKLYKKV